MCSNSGNVRHKAQHVCLLSGIICGGEGAETGSGLDLCLELTFSTNADFEHPGAEAISSWHTEALISGVVFGTHEDITGRGKSVRLDAFHLHVFHIGKVDRPEM